jgi:hypothetical protein
VREVGPVSTGGPQREATLSTRAIWIALGVLAVLAVLAVLGRGGVPLLAVALWAPGAAVMLPLRPFRQGLGSALFLPAACSPFLLAGVSALLLLSGLSPEVSARAATLLFLVSLACVLFVTRSLHPFRDEDLSRGVLFLSLALAFAVVVLPLVNHHYLYRSDAWFHGAVAGQIAERGLPPVEDPFFAGIRLSYFWLYHVLVVTLSGISGLDPFWVMALLCSHAVLVACGGIHLLARILLARPARPGWPAALVFLGMNALGIYTVIPRLLVGEARGLHELQRHLSLLDGGIAAALGFLAPFGGKAFFLEKFMVASAFSLALSGAILLLWTVLRYVRTGSRSWLLPLGLLAAGLLHLHTTSGAVIGLAAAAALAGGCRANPRLGWGGARVAWAALVLALLVSAPYLRQVLALRGGRPPLAFFDLRYAAGAFLTVALTLFFLASGIRRIALTAPEGMLAVAGWTSVLAVAAFAVKGVPHYLFHLYWSLAVVAGIGLGGMPSVRTGRWLRIALVLVLLPSNFVAVRGFLRDAHHAPEEERARADQATPPQNAIYEVLRERTQPDAVVIESGTGFFTPALARRSLLWGGDALALRWGYHPGEMARRREIWSEISSAQSLSLDDLGSLVPSRRVAYVLLVDQTTPSFRRLLERLESRPGRYQRIHATSSAALFRIVGLHPRERVDPPNVVDPAEADD